MERWSAVIFEDRSEERCYRLIDGDQCQAPVAFVVSAPHGQLGHALACFEHVEGAIDDPETQYVTRIGSAR